jgi:sodium/potassium-transporting ATPase subunit alpha
VGYGLKKEVDNLYLGIVLSSVTFVTGIFSYIQERKSSNLMESFKNMLPTTTVVVRDGKTVTIDAIQLAKGDVVDVKGGDKVPADLRIIECSDDLEVDNASLTGESEPQKRCVENTDENPLETKNLMFFGTLIPKGRARCVVINVGDQSVMGRIAKLATHVDTEQTPINKEIHHFIMIVSGVAIFLGVSFFIIGWSLGVDWITNLVFMIGIIVANVPEGLLATVTVCLTLTANRMATKSVLVKNLEGVETLGSTTCICSDKTGTLTQNVMTVANLVMDNKIWLTDAVINDGRYDVVSSDLPTFRAFQRCATLCNNAVFSEDSKFRTKLNAEGNRIRDPSRPIEFRSIKVLGDGSEMPVVNWTPVGDGSESALIKFVQDKRDIMEFRSMNKKVCEIPFNSANKYQVSVHLVEGSDNHVVVMKGAPERVINRCSHVMVDGHPVEMTAERREEIEKLQLELQAAGRRVLGFCERELDASTFPVGYQFNADLVNFPIGDDPSVLEGELPGDPKRCDKLVFVGLAALIDPPRPQVPPAVDKCKTAGIRVVMVTGDHPVTAKAIAQEVGIIWGPTSEDVVASNAAKGLTKGDEAWQDPDLAPAVVVPGSEFTLDTPDKVWMDILDHNQIVFARTSPQQKLIIVEKCQTLMHEVVAVTGDGVNDSPALKKADIGVAMGIMGSDVSKEAADMILLDDNFASIVAGIEEGRLIFDNLKKSIAYTLSSNIPEISPFLCFITLQTPLPLSTVLILFVDLGTDMVPAISMAWENAEADIMRRPPRKSQVDRLVTRKLVVFSYLQIGVIQAAAGFFTWMVVLNDYGYPPNVLIGLGAYDNWGKQVLFCEFDGGVWRNLAGKASSLTPSDGADMSTLFQEGFFFWDEAEDGVIKSCEFAVRNFEGSSAAKSGFDFQDASTYGDMTMGFSQMTMESMQAMYEAGFAPYVPYKAVDSPYWVDEWLAWPIAKDDTTVPGCGLPSDLEEVVIFNYQLPGYFADISDKGDAGAAGTTNAIEILEDCATCGGDYIYGDATFHQPMAGNGTDAADYIYSFATRDADGGTDGGLKVNVASRMSQKEALHHAQCAFFVSIVVVQWADLMICKTRWLSMRQQGMVNTAMNFGLLFETILASACCYVPAITTAVGTRPIRLLHWMPGVPFSVCIFVYDEVRKYWMRSQTAESVDKETGRVIQKFGWLARQTYY